MPSHIEYAATADFLADCCIFGELHMDLITLPLPLSVSVNRNGTGTFFQWEVGRMTWNANGTYLENYSSAKASRRFFAHASSLCPKSRGFSSP